MEEQVARDAIVWLLYASGPVKRVNVSLMGGEPLIRFKFLKKLIPFAKRRSREMGKFIHFGMTTNATLVSDEVVAFWKKWGLGFHTSIDGTAKIQDQNRPTTGGRPSSKLVESAVPKILAYRPDTTARSTVIPSSAGSLVESYKYFRSLGYTDIAFVPGSPSTWDCDSLNLFEEQYRAVTTLAIEEFRNGQAVLLKGIDEVVTSIVHKRRPVHACGAGRGLVLIDVHGDIWPCHRWNAGDLQHWRIGSIYEQFDESARAALDCENQVELLKQDCEKCIANGFCGGGCPVENLEDTGNAFNRHPNACELTRVWARDGQHFHDVLHEERNPLFEKVYYNSRS